MGNPLLTPNVDVPDLIKRIRMVGGANAAPSQSPQPTTATDASPTNVAEGNVPPQIAAATNVPLPQNPKEVMTASVTKPSLSTAFNADQQKRQVDDDTVAPPPPEISQAASQTKLTVPSAVQGAIAAPISSPNRAHMTFGEKLRAVLPYLGAIGGGLEAAGSPNHEALNAARLQQAETGMAERALTSRKLGIEQERANTEAKYKDALATQYGLQPYTYNDKDGNPVTIYLQQKDLGRVGTAGVNQAGQETKQEIANKGKLDVERLRQGAGVMVDPEYAKLAGQPQLAGQYINGQTLKNYISILRSKGIHIADLGDEGLWSVDNAGNKLKQVSLSSPSVARARAGAAAHAANTPVDVYDDDGNLKAISQAEQLRTGVPKAATEFGEQGPTSSVRTAGQTAAAVASHIPDLRILAAKLDAAGKLGPVMGRINTFLNEGYGGNDPDIAEFVSDMQLMNSGKLKAHFGARGASGIYDKFTQSLNTAQTLPAINGSLDSAEKWLKKYGDIGTFKPTRNASATSPSSSNATQPTHIVKDAKGNRIGTVVNNQYVADNK